MTNMHSSRPRHICSSYDVKSSGEDDEDGSDDDGKTTPRSNAAGEQGELGKNLGAAGAVVAKGNNLLTKKSSKAQLKDKTCFLFITKKGRGQRIPVQQFAIERKTNTGRQIKTEPGDVWRSQTLHSQLLPDLSCKININIHKVKRDESGLRSQSPLPPFASVAEQGCTMTAMHKLSL